MTDVGVVTDRSGLSGPTESGRRLAGVIIALFVLYLAAAQWTGLHSVDTFTNALAARSFAADGTPFLEESEPLLDQRYQGTLVWIVEADDGPVAQYPPGAALYGAAFYLLDDSIVETDTEFPNRGSVEPITLFVPSNWPAALAAAVSVVVAMAFLAVTVRPHVDERVAIAGVVVTGLGTGAWSVAANALWQHGPAMACIAAGVFLASRSRFGWSGVAFALALLVRPHSALIAAAIGIYCSWRRRSVRPMVAMGLSSALGLAGLLAYNNWVWGSPSIAGGYGESFGERVVDPDVLTLASRMIEALVHPTWGLLPASPIFVIAFVALAMHRKDHPDWAVGAAVGGVIYLLVQYKANRVSGGAGFWRYRYPLEAISASAPLLVMATAQWVTNTRRKQWFFGLAALSIFIHGYGAFRF